MVILVVLLWFVILSTDFNELVKGWLADLHLNPQFADCWDSLKGEGTRSQESVVLWDFQIPKRGDTVIFILSSSLGARCPVTEKLQTNGKKIGALYSLAPCLGSLNLRSQVLWDTLGSCGLLTAPTACRKDSDLVLLVSLLHLLSV